MLAVWSVQFAVYRWLPTANRELAGVRDGHRGNRPETGGGERVIAPVRLVRALATFFFDVGDFPVRRDFAIPADYASASEGSESQETHQTHCRPPPLA